MPSLASKQTAQRVASSETQTTALSSARRRVSWRYVFEYMYIGVCSLWKKGD